MDLSIHKVKKITISKIRKGDDYYVRDIVIKNDEAEEEITCFGDNKEDIKVEISSN